MTTAACRSSIDTCEAAATGFMVAQMEDDRYPYYYGCAVWQAMAYALVRMASEHHGAGDATPSSHSLVQMTQY